MTTEADSIARVHAAIRRAAGTEADAILHRCSMHLADLTPHELAQTGPGARVVLVELEKILIRAQAARQSRHADFAAGPTPRRHEAEPRST